MLLGTSLLLCRKLWLFTINYYNNDSRKLLLLWSLPLGQRREETMEASCWVGMHELVETNQVSTNYNDVYNKRMIVIFKICSITVMWLSLWLLITLKYIRVGSSKSQYSPWSSKNLIDWNQLKKFMQVDIDVTCMYTNFGGRDLSGFGDIATFKNGQISLSDHGLYIVHGHQKI